MSLNKVLNRPMFRKEALRKGALKPIKAKVGSDIGIMVGQPTTAAQVPAVVPGQGTYSRINLERFGPPKPTRFQNIARSRPAKFAKGIFNIPFAGGYAAGETVAKGLGIKDPLAQTPFGMAGGYLASKALPTLAAAPAGISAALLAGPAYLTYAGSKERERIANMTPKEREAHRRKSMQFGTEGYLTDTMFENQFGKFVPKPPEEFKPRTTATKGPGSGRVGFESRTKELKAEGDELLADNNSTGDVGDLNKIQKNSIGPVPPEAEEEEVLAGDLTGSITPYVTEKPKEEKADDKIDPEISKGGPSEIKSGDGENVTDKMIERARVIAKELRSGQTSNAKMVFLANLASGLMSGTTMKGGIGGAIEVFGKALGPAVNNYAMIKLKENELENEFMQSALEIASDEIERKNQAYEYPDGDPGVVQILRDGKTVNMTAIRLKDGTVQAAIPGMKDPNGRNVYTTLPPGTYVRFATNDSLAKPQTDLLRELDAKYRAYALGQKTIRILEDFQVRGETGAGPVGRFNLFKQRFSSAFKDILGRDIYDDIDAARRRVEKEKNKAISDLMVSEDVSREKAEEILQSQLGEAGDDNKIMKLIKDATGEEDKQKLSQLAINETVMVYALANSLKSKDRLTEKDIKMAKQLVNIFPLLRGQKDVIRDLRSVNNTILGDIESLQNNWTNALLGETATIEQYKKNYGLLDNQPLASDIYEGKTDEEIAGSITLD